MRAISFLGVGLYTFESTSFYLALERGTAAAVALLFYLYPAVVTVVEVALGAMRLRLVTVVSLLLALVGGTIVAVGGGRVAITPSGIGFVLASVAFFSTYVVAGHRVIPRTDALTAAAWTALGAAGGVTVLGVGQGALHVPSGRALVGDRGDGRRRPPSRSRCSSSCSPASARRAPRSSWRSRRSSAWCSRRSSSTKRLRPLVVVGGVAILAGAVLAAISQPAEHQEAAPPP